MEIKLKIDTVNHWAYWDNAFTKEECLKIIEYGNSLSFSDGTVGKKNEQTIDFTYRESQISWIHKTENSEWIYDKIGGMLVSLNERFFGFDISAFDGNLQFTKYEAPSMFYGKHIDRGLNCNVRKLSFSVQLTENTDYDGGDLVLHHMDPPEYMKREIGYMTVFPSYTLHEVTPVTRGTRYSLVGWVSGEPFK